MKRIIFLSIALATAACNGPGTVAYYCKTASPDDCFRAQQQQQANFIASMQMVQQGIAMMQPPQPAFPQQQMCQYRQVGAFVQQICY